METSALFEEAAALRQAKGKHDTEQAEYQAHLEGVLHESQVRRMQIGRGGGAFRTRGGFARRVFSSRFCP